MNNPVQLTRESTIKDMVDRINELVSLVNDSVSPAFCLKRIQPTTVHSLTKSVVTAAPSKFTIPITGVYTVIFRGTGKVQCQMKTEFNEVIKDTKSHTVVNSTYVIDDTLLADGDVLYLYATPASSSSPITIDVVLQYSFLELISKVTQFCDAMSVTVDAIKNTENNYSNNLDELKREITTVKRSITARFEDFENCKTDPTTGITYETVKQRLDQLTSVVSDMITQAQRTAQQMIDQCRQVINDGKEEVEEYIEKSIGHLSNLHINYAGSQNLIDALNCVPDFTGIYKHDALDLSKLHLYAVPNIGYDAQEFIAQFNFKYDDEVIVYDGNRYEVGTNTIDQTLSLGVLDQHDTQITRTAILWLTPDGIDYCSTMDDEDSYNAAHHVYTGTDGKPHFMVSSSEDGQSVAIARVDLTIHPQDSADWYWNANDVVWYLPEISGDDSNGEIDTPYSSTCRIVIGSAEEGDTLYDCDLLYYDGDAASVINKAIKMCQGIIFGSKTKLSSRVALGHNFNGGEIVIRQGTYTLNNPIKVDYNNITIKGESDKSVTLVKNFDSDMADASILIGSESSENLSNITIENMVLTLNTPNVDVPSGNWKGIVAATSDDSTTITGLSIKKVSMNTCTIGVHVVRASQVVISDLNVTDHRNAAVHLENVTGCEISRLNSIAYHVSTYNYAIGVFCNRYSSDILIHETCKITGANKGVNILGDSTSVKDSKLLDCNACIEIAPPGTAWGCKHILVDNNCMTGVKDFGVITPGTWPGSNNNSEDITITNNTIIGVRTDSQFENDTGATRNAGIWLYSGTKINISKNKISYFDYGVHTYSYNTEYMMVDIDHNFIQRCRYGVNMDRAIYSKIVQNTVLGCYASHISISSSRGIEVASNIVGWNTQSPSAKASASKTIVVSSSDPSNDDEYNGYITTQYCLVHHNILLVNTYTNSGNNTNKFTDNTVIPLSLAGMPIG